MLNKEMRIAVISLVMTFLMINETCTYMDMHAQEVVYYRSVESNTDAIPSSIDDCKHFISETSNWFPNVWEKPCFSYNIVSVVRQLLENISFKEFYTKNTLKNKIIFLETVVNVCHSLKLYNGYYIFGLGKLRC
jgi:hypothetical protein